MTTKTRIELWSTLQVEDMVNADESLSNGHAWRKYYTVEEVIEFAELVEGLPL